MIARVILFNDLFDGEKPDISELLREIPPRILIGSVYQQKDLNNFKR